MNINTEALSILIAKSKDDKEILDFSYSCLMDFEAYHSVVFKMESQIGVYKGALAREVYQEISPRQTEAVQQRTTAF